MDSTSAESYRKFSADVVYQHYNQAISVLNPLLGPQSPAAHISRPSTASIQTPSTGGAGPNLIDTNNTVMGS